MQSVFYGVGACVIGIIAISAHKLTVKSVGKDKLLWAIYLVLAAATIITESEIAWIFIAAGFLVWIIRCKPGFKSNRVVSVAVPLPFCNVALGAATDSSTLIQIALF